MIPEGLRDALWFWAWMAGGIVVLTAIGLLITWPLIFFVR